MLTLRIGALALALALALTPLPAAAGDLLPSFRSKMPRATAPRAEGVPDDATLHASGARIGVVRMNRIDLFDTSIPEEDIGLFRLANVLHIETREATVREQLLFKPGEPYSARLLQETERVLRSTRYLRDARVVPVAYREGLVDIEVTTQDVWTLNPAVSFGRKGGANSTSFSMEELNLLGLGSELSMARSTDVDRSSQTLLYRDRHVAGTWWGLGTQYARSSDGNTRKLDVERPFYALDARWAAGASVHSETRTDAAYDGGKVINRFYTRERKGSVYGGFSAGLQDGWATRWTLGLTHDLHEAERVDPAVVTAAAPAPHRDTYPWVGWELVQDAFVEARNLHQLEKTEDVSLGWQSRFQLGVGWRGRGSERSARHFKAHASKGWLATRGHTLLWSGSAVGRIEQGQLAGAMLGSVGRYHWRQSAHRTFFTRLQVDAGARLDADQSLQLGGDNGLRGYPLRYQGGRGRWLFTAEQRAYTEWYPYRVFNVGGAIFFDAGRTWRPIEAAPVSRGLLRDVGFGLRLGNSRTAIGSVLHIDFAFPLDGDPSIKRAQFIVEAKTSF